MLTIAGGPSPTVYRNEYGKSNHNLSNRCHLFESTQCSNWFAPVNSYISQVKLTLMSRRFQITIRTHTDHYELCIRLRFTTDRKKYVTNLFMFDIYIFYDDFNVTGNKSHGTLLIMCFPSKSVVFTAIRVFDTSSTPKTQ